ncbi:MULTISPECIES: hypothetical protein [Streptomyces]|uniref:Uncharacterized protein n=2 Tax=Streptomyces TaxID=1883 RepID=A0A117IWM8_9ACTN|nr:MULTISPECIES: hypothetical protein [Streptomyces]KUH38423.1 hypothetical protein ATE80_13220 [Streptomyces kanasensis]UUS30871.1 hypothetical protein NRO40_08485 [Streptomyces changanensis]
MNARRVTAAAGVVHAAMQSRQTAAGIAAALEAACLLQSPETAAEQRETAAALRDTLGALLETQVERDALRARVAELETERHSTNEALSDAAEALRANRDRIAELEALKPARFQDCPVCGAGYEYGQPCSQCEFRSRMAAAEALAERSTPPVGDQSGPVCQCRTDRDGDGTGWIRYQGRDGEFVELRCRNHAAPGVSA